MLTDAISSLGAQAYTVTHRVNAGTDGHGRALSPTTSTTSIVGLLQPMSGREIERLPEGLHQKELRLLITTGTLTVADSNAGTMGDHVAAYGVAWEVVRIETWDALGCTFNKYVLSRVDP